MQKFYDELINNNRCYTKQGQVATYIPELAKKNPNALGIYVYYLDGSEYGAGDYQEKFTMQSVSKILTLMLALKDNGVEEVFSHVGSEPTGDSFNSIVNLEEKAIHKPYNPMINAGAIVTSSLVKGNTVDEKIHRLLDFTKKLTDNESIIISEETYLSEKLTGDRNRALAYFMKSFKSLSGNVEEILDFYFKQCSILVNCKDLAKIAAVLANNGVLPWNNERIIPDNICRITKTLMTTCGLYDYSGDFAIKVGLPSKSGVGGGILSTVPNKMGIATYAPALDTKGNSSAGIATLTDLSEKLDLSIF